MRRPLVAKHCLKSVIGRAPNSLCQVAYSRSGKSAAVSEAASAACSGGGEASES